MIMKNWDVFVRKGRNSVLIFKDAEPGEMFDPSQRLNVGGREKFRSPRRQVASVGRIMQGILTVSQAGQTA